MGPMPIRLGESKWIRLKRYVALAGWIASANQSAPTSRRSTQTLNVLGPNTTATTHNLNTAIYPAVGSLLEGFDTADRIKLHAQINELSRVRVYRNGSTPALF